MEALNLNDYQYLLQVAQKITAEPDITRLCDTLLHEALQLYHADGGTLYLAQGQGEQRQLEFALVRNYSLHLHTSPHSGSAQTYPAVPLYVSGKINTRHIASCVAVKKKLINIPDVYQCHDFDFSGTQDFDARFGYRTQSVLALPLCTDDGELIGVLQLLNAQNTQGDIIAFAPERLPVIMVLARFAASALQKQRSLQDQKALLVALAGAPNAQQLLERILDEAQSITGADGGTLYLLKEENGLAQLEFTLLRSNSLNLKLSPSASRQLPAIPLTLADGSENHHHVAAHAALSKTAINVQDAYLDTRFDFSGTQDFDRRTGYRSASFLTVPLLNHSDDVIGVLQLVNAIDPDTKHLVPFDSQFEPLVKALARYAAMALNNLLLVDELKNLLDAFIKVLAVAIDAKSPHTSGHCQRVPLLTELLAQAACADQHEFASFSLDEDGWYELKVAAWLHDCGKLATPDSVLDKATKLQSLFDRIELVETRCASLRQHLIGNYWHARASLHHADTQALKALEQEHQADLAKLAEDLAFLQEANQGSEFMSAEKKARVVSLAQRHYPDAQGQMQPLLNADELASLCIERGTLSQTERDIINNHIVVTQTMLESLPFPRKLKRVPEYAGGHHEKVNGTGYPRGLRGEQMSVPAKMMAIADIFEALTAKDRPYKAPMKISQALGILQRMRNDGHIDPALYTLFLRARVWEKYAQAVLDPTQLDVTDIASFV